MEWPARILDAHALAMRKARELLEREDPEADPIAELDDPIELR